MRVDSRSRAIEAIWRGNDFTGDRKPTARCTVHRGNVRLTSGGQMGMFSSIIFSVGAQPDAFGGFLYYPKELPNVKSVSWNRDVDTDVASCTIVLYNTDHNPDQGTDVPGYLTWNRGNSAFEKSAGYTRNKWYGLLVPDNVIRTFEGYGVDYSVGPELDTHMMLTGNWLIDTVEMSNGMITLQCRDFGRILIDQILFPPITPRQSTIPGLQYPISFAPYSKGSPVDGGKPLFFAYSGSSNTPYTGPDGYQAGHYAREAMDGNQDTFWLSVGNSQPNAGYSYEWVEGSLHGETVASINVKALYANMQGFVSVMSNGVWQGGATIPYDPNNPSSAPNGSNIPYVAQFVTTGFNQRVGIPVISKAQKVRVTFTNLQNSGIGPYVYRAGVREFGVYAQGVSSPSASPVVDGGADTTRHIMPYPNVRKTGNDPNKVYALAIDGQPVVRGAQPGPQGNYSDFTDIVKLFCAWGGFHWPKPIDQPFVAISKGPGYPNGFAFQIQAKPANDKYLKNGRVWGDLQDTGTHGPAPLTSENFDKKTIMDGISYIRTTVNFLFLIDESGGVQWRSPNYFNRGNVVNGRRVKRFVRILDTSTLQDISVTLSSKNARERVYIATPDGKYTGSARGYSLNPIGLRRIAGWIDQNWASNKECQVAATFTAIAQMVTYRTDNITIAGLPTMQIDDQIEVVDKATGEGYLHYVRGIQSALDNDTGVYTYQLTTNWLGAKIGQEWAFSKYGGVPREADIILDSYDIHRRDGAYDGFAPVTI